ncbi:hypothetical protein [Pandoraea fibrosis]|uniref:Uncharacterized protein n=1 Tax=Pandoraea fibrosis TaxID=1891094 RepID=A0A5E4XH54_9BURK|nr:hypothetical protein [Pandoraea fibrosis]VVE35606.1 hypothetical protein PFI31113_03845 [Pandoraea fibrosis]
MKDKRDRKTAEIADARVLPTPTRQPYMSAEWFKDLQAVVAELGVTRTAQRMKTEKGRHVSRTNLSQFLHGLGEYRVGGRARPHLMEARYRQAFERITCPQLGESLTFAECRAHSSGPPPKHNPLRLTFWIACQGCSFKPATKGKQPHEQDSTDV